MAWRGKLSSERPLPGLGPQGSSWGILEYLSQSSNSADNVPEDERAKFMDDLTILEIILLANVGLASHHTKSNVPTNIAMHNQFIPREHLKTQKYVEDIDNWTELNKMKLNENKTKQIIFNFTKDHQFSAEIRLKNKNLEVINKTKLLGAIITSDLKWHENTKFIVKVSKGKYEGYKQTLQYMNLESLKERRKNMALKFAKKSLKLVKFSEFFPLNNAKHLMKKRNQEKYVVPKKTGPCFKWL